ncbi:MAG: DUF362 domain-containing protein [Nitrososphaerota archaeon]|nr:DUF362 domain-containing protein [Candidatus Bathyarchaeota archaeon]MDW8061483.1 DUF362 domain-containing protein [Nitrososphaerota archaeon]
MKVSEVVIVKSDDPVEATSEALEVIKASEAFKPGEKILVKPNYIDSSHPSLGVTTDARIVEGVVRYFKVMGFNRIAVGEGSGFADTMEAFRVAGIDRVAEKYGVDMVDLNRDEYIEADVPGGKALKKVRIAKTAIESAIVSVPKLKVHRLAVVTLSLKNLMGVVSPKGVMHGRLNTKIVDLAMLLRPRLAVVDGIIGGEVHETAHQPVEVGVVIAGLDPVAVDSVASMVMGIDPMDVPHLREAEARGLGVCDPRNIRVVGEKIEEVSIKFRRSYLSFISFLER